MPSCSICIDELKTPVSLPCGHIFCEECIVRAITIIKPYNPIHFCPTCRSAYTISNVDPNAVPAHLRLQVIPSLRRLYLDETNPHVDLSMSHRRAVSECARLQAENAAMKMNCSLWRRRAEVHAGATLGLLALARDAKHHALKWKSEKEELERQLNTLKRKLKDRSPEPFPPISQSLKEYTAGCETSMSSSLGLVFPLLPPVTRLDDEQRSLKRPKLATESRRGRNVETRATC